MPVAVFLLVFASAALHVLWNALVKTCENKASFAWLTCLVSVVVSLPVFLVCRATSPGALHAEVWALAALSGLVEAIYIVFLYKAYEWTDLSVVYPLSRGLAPLVTWA